jgi:spore coat protein U-like protein
VRRLFLFGVFVGAVQLLMVAAPANAAISCSYSGASHSVTVGMTANNDSTTIVRSDSAIDVSEAACGSATVNNTDTITVNGSSGRQNLTIDLSGGAFAPGSTPDPSSSEIEFQVS